MPNQILAERVKQRRKISADKYDQRIARREREMLLKRTVSDKELAGIEAHAKILAGVI